MTASDRRVKGDRNATIQIALRDKSRGDLVVEAAIVDSDDPNMIRFLAEDDQLLVAAIPTKQVLFIVESCKGR